MIDLAIVGGGAAGIAAAREARDRGLTCVILEASDRIGGRACTIEWQGHALDLGATWLHSASRNPLGALAEQIGFDIDRSPVPWRKQFKNLGFSQEEQAQSWEAMEALPSGSGALRRRTTALATRSSPAANGTASSNR